VYGEEENKRLETKLFLIVSLEKSLHIKRFKSSIFMVCLRGSSNQ
jgi:hypothetical protein